MRHEAEFIVRAGEKVPFVLTVVPVVPQEAAAARSTPFRAVERTTAWWKDWSSRSTYHGKWDDVVQRSLITLKALTYAPTGRHRRRAHDVAARVAGRRAQLGLPLLLVARRDVHALLADDARAT